MEETRAKENIPQQALIIETQKIRSSAVVLNGCAYAKALMQRTDPSHDYFHAERVLNNALYIAREEQLSTPVDLQVIALAALFHDSVDFKYDKVSRSALEELAMKRLDSFFTENQISEERQKKIIYIIANISFRKELESSNTDVPVELKIVRDADRLDSIGAIGVARCFGFSCIIKQPFYDPKIKILENLTVAQYNNQLINNTTTAYNHFHEKLLKLKDKMCTKVGKKLAQKRHDFMIKFLEQFEDEMTLK